MIVSRTPYRVSLAGGGGFLLFLIPAERQAALRARLGDPLTLRLVLDTAGTTIVYQSARRGP